MFWLSDVTTGTASAKAMRERERRARAARAEVVAAFSVATARAIKRAVQAARRIGDRLCAQRRRERTLRAIAQLDRRGLADIGLRPDDVRALERGVWPDRVDPAHAGRDAFGCDGAAHPGEDEHVGKARCSSAA